MGCCAVEPRGIELPALLSVKLNGAGWFAANDSCRSRYGVILRRSTVIQQAAPSRYSPFEALNAVNELVSLQLLAPPGRKGNIAYRQTFFVGNRPLK
jgi:hypothetical protein